MTSDDRLASLPAVAGAAGSAELSTGQAVKFLLADFDALLKLKEESVKISDRRIDMLLAIISAAGAGLALLSQTHISPRDFLYVAAFGLFGVIKQCGAQTPGLSYGDAAPRAVRRSQLSR
jgi:hypothetical protein